MTTEQAIYRKYGCRVAIVPEDGKMRAFKIDPFRIGFVIDLGGVAAFGCWSEGEFFSLCGDQIEEMRSEVRATGKDVDFERMIVEIARASHKRNGGITVEENDRLQQAVRFIEARS